MNGWIVGAGRAAVVLSDACFPTAENYTGVHEEIAVRALYLENGEKALIVTLEQTSILPQTLEVFREAAERQSGLDADRIWITASHTFAVPHIWDDGGEQLKNEAERQRNTRMRQAFTDAVEQAVRSAVDSRRAAKVGFTETFCGVNISRDLPTAEGYWLGCWERGLSDKTVAVLRFEDLAGELIAVFFNYGIQSSVMQDCSDADGRFLMSGDVAGAACRYLEQEYGVPAVFCVGACGDQGPCLQAVHFETDHLGVMREVRVDQNAGFAIAELLGRRLGAAVSAGVEQVVCAEACRPMELAKVSFECPGQKILPIPELHPTREYAYIPQGTTELAVEVISLGIVTLVGVKPEMTSYIALDLKARAPGKVILCNMVNGAGKYLAHDSAYDQCRYEAMNSRYAKGSAAIFAEKTLTLLEAMQ